MIDFTIVRARPGDDCKQGEADQPLGRSRGRLSAEIHACAGAKGSPFAPAGGEAHGLTSVAARPPRVINGLGARWPISVMMRVPSARTSSPRA
jgi:hypothetical protein